MRPDQRRQASEEVAAMLRWCLDNSVRPSGEIIEPDKGDQICDSYYFAAAFLDTIGFFDQTKRFWAKELPQGDPVAIKQGMIAELGRFNADLTMVDDARERLGARPRPWSNAVL